MDWWAYGVLLYEMLAGQVSQLVCLVGCSELTKIQISFGDNLLPNDKILDMTKSKAFADKKLNVAKMTIFLFDRVESTGEKGENAGYQHF